MLSCAGVMPQYPHMSANGMVGESAALQYGAGGVGVGGRGGLLGDEMLYGMGMGRYDRRYEMHQMQMARGMAGSQYMMAGGGRRDGS